MRHYVDISVLSLLHDLRDFFRDKARLFINQLHRPRGWLLLKVKEVAVNARIPLLKLVNFGDVLEQAVSYWLELIDGAFVSHYEEVDKLINWLDAQLLALPRIVDVIYRVSIWV